MDEEIEEEKVEEEVKEEEPSEEMADTGTFQTAILQETIHTIMTKILATPERLQIDNRKIANLSDMELGRFISTVRGGLNLVNVCKFYGMDDLAKFYSKEVEDTETTSLSKKGFSILAMITTKKEEELRGGKRKWRK